MGSRAFRISAKISRYGDSRLLVIHKVGGGTNVLPITDRFLVGLAGSLGGGDLDEQRCEGPQANDQ